VIMALLRFICLTLPNCAGFDLKTLSKEENQEKVQKRQKHVIARSGEHISSQWRASWNRKQCSLASYS
jgi:hypothetical protein